jgi:catechol 2,3-dioxygenase-like lactoylglutathione lyase family enzyme
MEVPLEFLEMQKQAQGAIAMIGVRKISHASYETPDLEKQTEYYTDILGLTLVAREKDAVYLANTIEHHSVILRKGSEPKCTRLGFQIGPDDDLDAFEKQTAAHGLRTSRKNDAEPTIDDMVVFEDPKGTVIEVFKRPEPQRQAFRPSGIIPHKLGHVAFHVTDVAATTRFYCEVLGFRVSDWMGDYFSFLRCGVDHHTINLVETGSNKHFHTAFELRDWAHIQTACDFLSNTATGSCGGRDGTASGTISSPITAARMASLPSCSPNSIR